jgi:outer membrane immunogenic protein
MKKILALAALMTIAATISNAADLPSQPQPYRAPIAASPAFDWTGFYIGVMGGYGWSNNANVGGFNVTDANLKGGFIGGTLGTNWQMGMIVLGVEADGAWSGINRTETDFLFGISVTLKDQIQAFGSVTGRFGVALQNVMIYGKGGYGWMDNQISGSALGVTVSESHFHNGWTVGGGVEVAFAGPWSVKGEYMFARYLNEPYTQLNGVTLGADVQTIKAGINYRLNAPPAAVTARY